MSKTVSQEISELISEIGKLEAERERQLTQMDHLGLLGIGVSDALKRQHWTYFQTLENLNSKIDYARQKLMSMELISINDYSQQFNMNIATLDNSIKSLQSTTNKVLISSTKLERLTTILIYTTVLLIIISIFNISIILLPINPLAGLAGTVGSIVVMIYLWIKLFSFMLRKHNKAPNPIE